MNKFFGKIAHLVNDTGVYKDVPRIEAMVYGPITDIFDLCNRQQRLNMAAASLVNEIDAIKLFNEYSLNANGFEVPCWELKNNLIKIHEFGGTFGMSCVPNEMLFDGAWAHRESHVIMKCDYKDMGLGYIQNTRDIIENNYETVNRLFGITSGIRMAFNENRLEYQKKFGK